MYRCIYETGLEIKWPIRYVSFHDLNLTFYNALYVLYSHTYISPDKNWNSKKAMGQFIAYWNVHQDIEMFYRALWVWSERALFIYFLKPSQKSCFYNMPLKKMP